MTDFDRVRGEIGGAQRDPACKSRAKSTTITKFYGHNVAPCTAAAALVAAAFYLLLSGAEVATQRSFFMTAVVLIAVMVDRRAVTFRTLAVAAMIVLAIAPEALVHPSFQMFKAAPSITASAAQKPL